MILIFYFWLPIILIGLTLFIFKQLDDGSGSLKLPVWVFFCFIFYFIPIGNLLIFAFLMSVILNDDSIELRKNSILHKFGVPFCKFVEVLNKEVNL